jgi:hypothetical protein
MNVIDTLRLVREYQEGLRQEAFRRGIARSARTRHGTGLNGWSARSIRAASEQNLTQRIGPATRPGNL